METLVHSEYLPEGSKLGFGNYNVVRSKSPKWINVLLVGRSQTGKSTIVETLLLPQKGTGSRGFSDTRKPACNALIITDEITKDAYQLNIIDTPGLQEVREDETSRSDDELLKLATKCVEENITSLNVVCFVSKAGETHRLDIEAFKKVKECLGDNYSKISMMVLTHCDEFPEKTLEEYIQAIKVHDISKPYYEYCNLGIVKYGALNLTKVESEEEDVRPILVQSRLKRIEKMRNNFLQTIISCAEIEVKSSELQQILDESKKAQLKLVEEAFKKGQEEVIQKAEEEKLRQEQEKKQIQIYQPPKQELIEPDQEIIEPKEELKEPKQEPKGSKKEHKGSKCLIQ